MTLISQGAEARIERQADMVLKRRVPKTYRLEQIDKTLRRFRTKREAKVMRKAKALGVPVPRIYETDDEATLQMDYIKGERLRDRLLQDVSAGRLLEEVGNCLALLHDATIIHGDLTTSNVLVTAKNELYLIDFGLSFFSTKIEDKAVDIHLLEQALISTHHEYKNEFFRHFLKGYRRSENSDAVLQRLKGVRARGRNKQ